MSNLEPFKRKHVMKYILLTIIVTLLAINIFFALSAFRFHINVIETTSTSITPIKTITITTTETITITTTKTITITTTTRTQINVNFQAGIVFSTINLFLNNYDNRPYHFVKLEITDAQSGTIVYTLKIDVTLLSNGLTSFSISIPPTIQQGRTYIITLYTDDGYKISTTVG